MAMHGTRRQDRITRGLRDIVPAIPLADAQSVKAAAIAPKFRALPPGIALWLALIAHIRHQHTEYDTLLAEGYARDEARFFTRGAIDDVLTGWGSARQVSDDDDRQEGLLHDV